MMHFVSKTDLVKKPIKAFITIKRVQGLHIQHLKMNSYMKKYQKIMVIREEKYQIPK